MSEPEEKEWQVTASTTLTATFLVWAETEEEARELVTDALVAGRHAMDYRVEVPDAIHVDADDWDAHTVVGKP